MSSLYVDQVAALSNNSITNAKNTDLTEQADFSQWLKNEISTANNQINEADMKLREFAVGQSNNVHDVMMSLEKAKTSFELVVEVRNRLLEGYQEIMRMQI